MSNTSQNMQTEGRLVALAAFTERLTGAVGELKHRLQEHYEHIHPGHTELVRRAIAEAEVLARDLSFFPHLFLPDFAEARIAELALQPAYARSEAAFSYAA